VEIKSLLLSIVLALFSANSFAEKNETVKGFVENFSKNKNYNANCTIDNYKLIANDEMFREKTELALAEFGGMSIADFDMGECITPDNIRDNVFTTHFWQKNNKKLNHNLDLFLAYDFKQNYVLSIIIDNNKNAYLMGDKLQDLKNSLKTNPIYVNNFSGVNLETELKIEDLKTLVIEQDIVKDADTSLLFSPWTYKKEQGAQWNISCRKDRFDGTKMCFMNSDSIMVGIVNGNYSVYVGGDHYPNTASAIKIDNNPAIYGFEGHSKTPLKVIEQMKKGRIAYTRYKKWPYEYNRDGEVDLSGFTLKFNELVQRYKSL
jgi:hypothetical protein